MSNENQPFKKKNIRRSKEKGVTLYSFFFQCFFSFLNIFFLPKTACPWGAQLRMTPMVQMAWRDSSFVDQGIYFTPTLYLSNPLFFLLPMKNSKSKGCTPNWTNRIPLWSAIYFNMGLCLEFGVLTHTHCTSSFWKKKFGLVLLSFFHVLEGQNGFWNCNNSCYRRSFFKPTSVLASP
jgi:hypothetical protein